MNIHDRDEIKRLEAQVAALTAALEWALDRVDEPEEPPEPCDCAATHSDFDYVAYAEEYQRAKAALDAAGGTQGA